LTQRDEIWQMTSIGTYAAGLNSDVNKATTLKPKAKVKATTSKAKAKTKTPKAKAKATYLKANEHNRVSTSFIPDN